MNLPPRLLPSCLPLLLLLGSLCGGGCATIRVTDPPHTATEQFLMTVAAQRAISQLSLDGLRDRLVYVDSTLAYVQSQPSAQDLFVVAELRARLLREGVRLTTSRTNADVVVEVRTGALGVDRLEYLLGLPATNLVSGLGQGQATTGLPVSIPELAILKSTKQRGFASVAIIAYRDKTGELIAQSGPFIGRTVRDDYWLFGVGPKTIGNIPPAEEGK
jgi:uncharacterized protein DUF6655